MKRKVFPLIAAMATILIMTGCDKDKADEKASDLQSLYDNGIEIISVMEEMTGSDVYAELYSLSSEISDLAAEIAGGDYSTQPYVYEINCRAHSLMLNELNSLPDNLKELVENRFDSALASQINARESADAVAAGSVFTADKIFVADKDTESCIYLYTYENAYPVMVSFTAGDGGAVYAKGVYIFNKDLKNASEEEINEFLSDYKASVKTVVK